MSAKDDAAAVIPHTHETEVPRMRQMKLCRCTKCGYTARCTPSDDFYGVGETNPKPLYCSACFRAYAAELFTKKG